MWFDAGHTLAFAVLMNGVSGKVRRAVGLQDRVGSALASWQGPQRVAQPVVTPETAIP